VLEPPLGFVHVAFHELNCHLQHHQHHVEQQDLRGRKQVFHRVQPECEHQKQQGSGRRVVIHLHEASEQHGHAEHWFHQALGAKQEKQKTAASQQHQHHLGRLLGGVVGIAEWPVRQRFVSHAADERGGHEDQYALDEEGGGHECDPVDRVYYTLHFPVEQSECGGDQSHLEQREQRQNQLALEVGADLNVDVDVLGHTLIDHLLHDGQIQLLEVVVQSVVGIGLYQELALLRFILRKHSRVEFAGYGFADVQLPLQLVQTFNFVVETLFCDTSLISVHIPLFYIE